MESIEWPQRALRVDPRSKDALTDMGRSPAKMGRVAEATEHLQRAVESAPRDPQVQFVLGMALAHERRYSEPRDHLQEAVRLRPEAAEPRARLQQVETVLRRQEGRP